MRSLRRDFLLGKSEHASHVVGYSSGSLANGGLKALAGTKAAYAPKVEFIFLNGNLMERRGWRSYLSAVADQMACPKEG